MAVRYDKKFQQEIARTVRNFNAKVRRLERKGAKHIPSRTSVREIRANNLTRKDIRDTLTELKAFGKRGVEKEIVLAGDVRTTQYNQYIIQRRAKQVIRFNQQRIQSFGKIVPKVRGKKQDFAFGEYGGTSATRAMERSVKHAKEQLQNIKKGKITQAEYYRYMTFLKTQTEQRKLSDYRFKQNFKRLLTDAVIGADLPAESANRILNKIDELTPAQFYAMYQQNKELQDILEYGQYETPTHHQRPTKQEYADAKKNATDSFHSLEDLIEKLVEDFKTEITIR